MIRAVVYTSPDADDCFISGFCEGTSVTGIKVSDDGPEVAKHVFSEEYGSGLLMGGVNSRCILLVHLACQGKTCTCERFAVEYLQHDKIDNLQEFCKKQQQSVTFPFLGILMDGKEKACLTNYAEHDFHVEMVPQFSFSVRDCFFTDVDTLKFPNIVMQPEILHDIDVYEEAQIIIDNLALNYNYWPKVSGLGLSYCYLGDKSALLINNPTDNEDLESVADVARPKGPITAFNYFSKCARRSVIEDLPDKNMSNNELNKVLGQKWKEMSYRERNPYHIRAAQDRKRYLEEITVFNENKRDRKTARQCDAGKPLTAYNHFVRQEKQFVMGLGLPDAQTRMGKHGGDRWNEMDKAEKALYLVLKEAEAAEHLG